MHEILSLFILSKQKASSSLNLDIYHLVCIFNKSVKSINIDLDDCFLSPSSSVCWLRALLVYGAAGRNRFLCN